MSNRAYLGDSVYAEFDGYHVVLTTNNGYPDDPRNVIALEPAVYSSLLRFVGHVTRSPGDDIARAIEQEGDLR